MKFVFAVEDFKKAASVGVFGSVYLLAAAVFGVIEAQGTLFNGMLIGEIFWLVLVSVALTYFVLKFKLPIWSLSLVPAVSWVAKEGLKQFAGLTFGYDADLFAEALFVGLPIGAALFWLIYEKQWLKVFNRG